MSHSYEFFINFLTKSQCIYTVEVKASEMQSFIMGASSGPVRTTLKLLILLHLIQHGISQPQEISVAFLQDAFHSLNVQALRKIRVKSSMQCLKKCIKNPNCVSYNLQTQQDHLGLRRCELLAKDKYNSLDRLIGNESYHHYSRPVCTKGKSFFVLTTNLNFLAYLVLSLAVTGPL